MLSTHFARPHVPGSHELALLDLYAQQAANYIERQRLDVEQKEREEQVRMLLREVNHRSKNMLAVVQSIARHSMRSNQQSFIGEFEQRLQSLARSQDLLVRNEWRGAPIEELIRTQLAHLGTVARDRIIIDGEDKNLTPAAAQTLGMAMHELATNAAKYGALSGETGEVAISWAFVDGDAGKLFRMTWEERSGPKVEPPVRRGFGTTVLETVTARGLGATAILDYRSDGLVWRLTCDAERVVSRT